MKKTFYPFLLGLLMAACQQQQPVSKVAVPAHAAPSSRAALPKWPVADQPNLFKPDDTLSAAMREELRQVNLSKLWASDTEERRSKPVLKGFFGPDHYRFEMVFSTVSRDAQNPALYHVTGKCHYRKNIRSFTGSLLIRVINDLQPPYDLPANAATPNQIQASNASPATDGQAQKLNVPVALEVRAELRIQEALQENAGEFVGDATLLCYVNTRHQPDYIYAPMHNSDSMMNGASLLIRGVRWNVSTQQSKQFVVSDNLFAAAPEVYKDFGVGDRGDEINPKYAKLGWSNYWENDEWWADSPKPKLSL